MDGHPTLAQARDLFLGDYSAVADPKWLRECDIVDSLSNPAQKYASKEFEMAPPNGVSAATKTSENGGTAAVDFYTNAPRGYVGIYSIERTDCSSAKPMTESEFRSYWDSFLPDDLTKNFGKGHYALLKQYETSHGPFPAIGFIGTGMHGDNPTSQSP